MGSFSAKLRVWNPTSPEKAEEVEAMVDAGAAFSWIHRERLERMGMVALRRTGFGPLTARSSSETPQRYGSQVMALLAQIRSLWQSATIWK